jgi:hypothetical protein
MVAARGREPADEQYHMDKQYHVAEQFCMNNINADEQYYG